MSCFSRPKSLTPSMLTLRKCRLRGSPAGPGDLLGTVKANIVVTCFVSGTDFRSTPIPERQISNTFRTSVAMGFVPHPGDPPIKHLQVSSRVDLPLVSQSFPRFPGERWHKCCFTKGSNPRLTCQKVDVENHRQLLRKHGGYCGTSGSEVSLG